MLRGVVIVAALRLLASPPHTALRVSSHFFFFHSRPDSYQGTPFPTRAASPLNLAEFSRELYDYPNPQKQFVLDGIRDGFHVGFVPATVTLRSRSRNLTSALDHPGVIDQYLATEVALHRVAGPFPSPPLPDLQVSPFGVIPKRNQPGKWRLILDLSSPHGSSVNDGIPKDPYSMHYVTVDDAIRELSSFGPGAFMAKFDVEAAYRNIPIHPSDHFLFGMRWRDQFYVDLVLPFGLRSAPYLFDAVASAVHWILETNYQVSPLLHYLDDFLTMGPANSHQCQSHVSSAFEIFKRLGLPLHPTKCEGPATTLVFLGIELDSIRQTARLPNEKFERILTLLRSWVTRRTCHRQELESLIGHLHHACKVVRPGRAFLRRMIDLLSHFRNRVHPIRINAEFRRDLQWWLAFFREWNGISFFLLPGLTPLPDLSVASDAAGSVGFGAFWNTHWFAESWSFLPSAPSIAFQELLPIVVASHLWGPQWSKQHVLFLCDNAAVVYTLNAGTSRCPKMMHLLRAFIRTACLHSFAFSARHTPGRLNSAADALSRFRFQEFQRLVPQADPCPSTIPPALLLSLVPPT